MVRNQTINVHCGCGGKCKTCKPKRRVKRQRKRRAERVVEAPTPLYHPFTPVYIQSGYPQEDHNPLLNAVRQLEHKVDNHHLQYYKNELRHRVANYNKGHITEGTQTDFKDTIPAETPYRGVVDGGTSSAKKLDDDFELADVYHTGSAMSAPDIRGENPFRRRRRESGTMSDSDVQEIRHQRGRGRQPDLTRKEGESDQQYEQRMERNRKAREKRVHR